jgi:hypothetical protein
MEPTDRWTKRRCRVNEKLVCWSTLRIITRGETYYEYETAPGMANIIVSDKEYFKQALKGFKGFDFYEK